MIYRNLLNEWTFYAQNIWVNTKLFLKAFALLEYIYMVNHFKAFWS